ncbi:hypothetical protein ACTXT7_009121 [Hymenolepis weldensis]
MPGSINKKYVNVDLVDTFLVHGTSVSIGPKIPKIFIQLEILEFNLFWEPPGHRIMHRDLKPENVLINQDGILKITDFGTARFKHLDTQTGPYTKFICTEAYAPPEQHLGMRHYDESFDMWSVGCIMTELWTRETLFPDLTLHGIIDLCGEINEKTLPGVESSEMYEVAKNYKPGQKRVLERKLSEEGIPLPAIQLISQFIILIRWQRLSAESALSHCFFVLMSDDVQDLKGLLQ